MTRRRSPRKRSLVLDLFGFLDVISCTIGTLILLILVLSFSLNNQNLSVVLSIQDDGSRAGLKPQYIDCSADGLKVLPSQELTSPVAIASPFSPFGRSLRRLSQDNFILIAVRPSCFPIFEQVRTVIEAQNLRYGYEPVDETWELKVEE